MALIQCEKLILIIRTPGNGTLQQRQNLQIACTTSILPYTHIGLKCSYQRIYFVRPHLGTMKSVAAHIKSVHRAGSPESVAYPQTPCHHEKYHNTLLLACSEQGIARASPSASCLRNRQSVCTCWKSISVRGSSGRRYIA